MNLPPPAQAGRTVVEAAYKAAARHTVPCQPPTERPRTVVLSDPRQDELTQ